MTKVIMEFEDSDYLGTLFQDAISQCLFMKMEFIVKLHKEKDTATEREKINNEHMLKFYDEKIAAYEAMRNSLALIGKND
jgi:hypothetical protein